MGVVAKRRELRLARIERVSAAITAQGYMTIESLQACDILSMAVDAVDALFDEKREGGGFVMATQEYLVLWHWRDESFSTSKQHSTVNATNAERAINKARKEMSDEYSMKKSDIVIDAVLRQGVEYR